MAVNTVSLPIAAERERYSTGFVTSQDGTTIGYRQLGHGPGIVVVPGAMSSAHNHMQLAEALADSFTVSIIDRRERGLSGAFSSDYSIQKEIEDLAAVLNKTGAQYIFGVSSGGIISLQAALTLPAIRKAAIFEPPLSLTRADAASILARFDQEIAQGKVAAALVTGMKGAQMGPPIFNIMPNWLLERLTHMAMTSEEKKGSDGYIPMSQLAPLLHYDFQLVVEISEQLERFRDVPADVLLMGGSKSPAYLKAALDGLETIIPGANRIEFPGLDHAASWNTDRGGQPQPIADVLRRFFA